MSIDAANPSRRRFLTLATTGVGLVGAGFVATPLVLSMTPSARAKAAGAPVEVDISKLEIGQLLTVEWQGKPVWIMRRTKDMLSALPTLDKQMADPKSDVTDQQPAYAKNVGRSINPEVLVVVGLCTHLGCSPDKKLSAGSDPILGSDWQGGFFCPCHGSKFDLAGRVYKNVPAPTNLKIPPHKYLSDTLILIGDDSKKA
jgi:ubiquinol-cytochrome c reductase iron-sulfur subunit